MQDLAKLFRLKQLLAHAYHQLCARIVFFQDHEFFGDLYTKAESDYDSVVERMIGLGQAPDLNALQLQVAQELQKYPMTFKENSEAFQHVLNLNKQILQVIEVSCKSGKLSQGTTNLLADHADKIEVECYKLQQRLKK